MNIAALDLNLLVAFEALLLEKSVSRAAARIGLSQPGMSNALARLRSTLNDRLFFRKGQALVPTTKTVVLSKPVLDALNLIRSAISDRTEFDPSTAELRFRILASDYFEMAIMPSFIRRLRVDAPGIQIQVRRPTDLFRLPIAEMTSDSVDAAIGFFPDLLPPGSGLVQTTLARERIVCVADRRSLRRGRLSMRQFANRPQIGVSLSKDVPGLMDEILAKHGYKRKVPVTCSGFLGVPWLVPGTDLLGVVPEKLALEVARTLNLQVHVLPVALPPMRLTLVWHERNTSNRAHQWLRLRLIQGSHLKRRLVQSRRSRRY
jgi:DNA-binding transcriptional LysR family regulator